MSAALEVRIAEARVKNDEVAVKFSIVERAVESARQIDAAAKTVSNEILREQFDTVMPLLKALSPPPSAWGLVRDRLGFRR